MSALLKVYSDSGHTTEITHSPNVTTALSGGVSSGATSIPVSTTSGMPAQGVVDIDTGGSLETVAYASISGSNLLLSSPLGSSHSSSAAVVQWYYNLPIGDQTNGILNDGTNATPNGSTNVNTYYIYNAGSSAAQSPSVATASGGVSTASGYADTLISSTNGTSGFATSVSLSNIASGSVVQFWLCAEVPTGQSNAGNAQVCQVNLSYATV